ncbi:MAG: hypothetical protein LQ348_004710 [Seirophora lacunosa]|nr:MAG: hypothetical protein LQ344_006741 [Seirophora lacunosa]KAI4183223.1 MAG: hypothetical protein LQ348_004710 [Seirophora lacunosa]
MFSSLSASQLYSLADTARANLAAGQKGAKGQDLRKLVAHAHLYDSLADRVDEMRERAARRQHPKSTASTKHEYSGTTAQDTFTSTGEAWTKTALAPDLYSFQPQMDTADQTSVSVTELDDPHETDMNEKPHNLPATINLPDVGEADPNLGEAEPELDSESASDSDSSSESDCCSEPDCSSVGSAQNTAIPLPISRPNTPRRLVHGDDDSTSASKSSSSPRDQRRKSQDLPPLRPYINTAPKPIRFVPKTPSAFGKTPTKGAPLSPQLCDETTDDLPPVEDRSDEPSEVLQQSQAPCLNNNHEAGATNRNVLSRYLSSLPWSRRHRSRETSESEE